MNINELSIAREEYRSYQLADILHITFYERGAFLSQQTWKIAEITFRDRAENITMREDEGVEIVQHIIELMNAKKVNWEIGHIHLYLDGPKEEYTIHHIPKEGYDKNSIKIEG